MYRVVAHLVEDNLLLTSKLGVFYYEKFIL